MTSAEGEDMGMGSSAVWGLGAATFAATVVETVEALTIVLAMGISRSWRSTLWGVAAAVATLVLFTAAAGYALTTWLPAAALQLTIGALLLIFGLQWLRKAILRSSGRNAMHDETQIFEGKQAAARAAGDTRHLGLDWFSFVVSYKGVFLEGVEVVFIVITFGLSAKNMPVAIGGATAAVVVVLAVASAVRRPLTKVPENTLKYGVGLLLATFGTFWSVEGLGIFGADRQSLEWPGADVALLVVLAGWFALSRVLVSLLRVPPPYEAAPDRPSVSQSV